MTTEPRVAFVTGASRGIGAGIARALSAAGHRVAVGFHEREDLAAAVVTEVAAAGGGAMMARLDLGDAASVRAAVRV
ncbi:MAG: SDR family NAD(P)-dependent oxidoreductase, partial [Planctomycetota bacterium]|nr:SDR family NAD(P)-dependent oxidoreductase [Planctomycetota bacterium]